MIYENGSLKRILVDGGYIENGIYHFYLQDHLGNNRVVAKSDGTVIQTTHYYPYGMSFSEDAFADKQPYKYNGKEMDTENGLNLYDYNARQMEAALGRFTTIDRFSEKYYSLFPYQYYANSPINNLDIGGDSIIVINHGEGIHMAMLIQNKSGKWQYFSVNGNNVYISGSFSGGRKFNDLSVGEFKSPQDFLESSYNLKDNDKSIKTYGFSEGYIIPTTEEQNNIMRKTFIDISQNQSYGIAGNNCSTTVQKSMEVAELNVYYTKDTRIRDI